MNKQSEALRCAEYEAIRKAEAKINALRRQHEMITEMLETLKYAVKHCTWPTRYGTQNEHQLKALNLIEKAEEQK